MVTAPILAIKTSSQEPVPFAPGFSTGLTVGMVWIVSREVLLEKSCFLDFSEITPFSWPEHGVVTP